MRYLMKQKLFSLGEKFTIKDESEQDVFRVEGKWISFGKKLTFRNMNEEPLFYIKQKVFAWAPTYHIHQGGPEGEIVATVRKKLWSFMKARFDITLAGGEPMETVGNFWQHEYEITRGGQTVVTISKKILAIRDVYTIDVAEGEDDAFMLSLAIVIDMVCHGKQN